MIATAARRLAVLLVTLGLCAGPLLAKERVERSLSQRIPLSQSAALSFENLLGSITVQGGGPAGGARIEARVLAEAETAEQARALADAISIGPVPGRAGALRVIVPVAEHPALRPLTEGKNLVARWVAPFRGRDTLAVEYAGESLEIGGRRGAAGLAVHVEVTLPHDVEARFRQVVGSIDCSRSRARLELESLQGDVRAVQLSGSLRVKTGGGRVVVHSFKGHELGLESASGDLELIDVSARSARLATGSGAIQGELWQIADLRIHTASGDIELTEVEPAVLALQSESGAVALATRLKGMREASIRAGRGDVTLRVGRMASFDLLATTGSGKLKVRGLPLDVVADSGPETRLRHRAGGRELIVRTDGGDVTVRPF